MSSAATAADLDLDLDAVLQGTRQAVEQAVDLVRSLLEGPFQAWAKGDQSPVTEIDLAVDKLLSQLLPRVAPAAWLSEETVDDPGRLQAALVWVVDPIDGTRSLIERSGQFCISVALCHQGAPLVGVVANPTTGERFYAAAGRGAWDENGRRLRVRATEASQPPRLLVSKRELARGLWNDLDGCAETEALSSLAYKLAKVARGDVDATMTPWTRAEWDAAAGDLLVREAGGSSVDIRGEPLRYNRSRPLFEGVVAGSPELLGRLASLRHELRSRKEKVLAQHTIRHAAEAG